MTKREFLNAILSANVSEEISKYASNALTALDKANSTRATSPSAMKKKAEQEQFDMQVLAVCSPGETVSTPLIKERLGSDSSSRVAASLKRLVVAQRVIEAGQTKHNGRKVNAFTVLG